MILTGPEIQKQVACRAITIEPFHFTHLNPNSYNYRLASVLRTSRDFSLDPRVPSVWEDLMVPADGFTLLPHRLYLGSTVERIGSAEFVPILIGRSSLGRLGMFLTASCDLGNLGPAHCWTLEIKVVQPLKVYPDMKIGQVSFWKFDGSRRDYDSPYTQHDDPTSAIFARVAC